MIYRFFIMIVCAALSCASIALAQNHSGPPTVRPLLSLSETFSESDSFSNHTGSNLSFLQTSSAPPALRLLYTANTRGSLFPCPT